MKTIAFRTMLIAVLTISGLSTMHAQLYYDVNSHLFVGPRTVMNMKRLLFVIFFVFTITFSYSQEIFPLTNAKWTGVYINTGIEHRYFSYILQGDTIVDNIQRSKLYYIPDINKPDALLIGYFHTIGNIVYYRKHEIEPGVFAEGLYEVCDEYESDHLLYDFSLQEGDIYSYTCSYGEPIQMRVTSVKQVEFDGFIRKKIIFNDYNSRFWMEGMGSSRGFFEGKEQIPISDDRTCNYICFSVNGEVLYLNPDYSECLHLCQMTY